MSTESYKHIFAKNLLAEWLWTFHCADDEKTSLAASFDAPGKAWSPTYNVYTEYPICTLNPEYEHGYNARDIVGLDVPWRGSVPSYEDAICAGFIPLVIFDVAVTKANGISYAIEVVHTHDVTQEKFAKLFRLRQKHEFSVYSLSAEWILRQVKTPQKLDVKRVI